MFPFYTIFPNGPLGCVSLTQAWVPMDDEHRLMFRIWPRSEDAPRVGFASVESHQPPRHEGELQPNTSDWHGRFRLVVNASNEYHLDRDLQTRNLEYTGIRGQHHQDQAITESMGPIYDRSSEHLGTSDAMIIRVRAEWRKIFGSKESGVPAHQNSVADRITLEQALDGRSAVHHEKG